MGAKHSKREALLDCTAPSGSPSSRISRTRSLPSKIFSRNLSREHGRFFRGRPLLEDVDGIDHIEEFKRLVEFEKLHEKESTGSSTKPEFVHSCIGSLRGSREEIIYEEEDDGIVVAAGDQQETPVGSVQASPSSSRSSSQTPSFLAEILAEAENFEAVDVAPEAIVVDVLVVVADDGDCGKPVMDQGYLLGSPKNYDRTDSDVISASEFVDKPLQIESLSVGNVSNLEETCNRNGLDVCEGRTFLEGYSLTAGDEDGKRSVASCSGAPVLKEVYYFTFQAQKHSGPRGTWKRLKRRACDLQNSGCQIESKMTGKGKVSLSFNNSGKQPRRHSFTDSRDFVWESRDLFGKRIKEEEEDVDDATPADMQPDAFPCGMPGQRNPFFKYDAGFLGNVPEQGYKRWSPKKTSKGTALARKVRGLGGSPKPVTSLESCLRAQMADAVISYRLKSEPDRVSPQMANAVIRNRVKRPLYFPSTVDEEGVLEDAVNSIPSSPNVRDVVDESSNSELKQSALPKLPNLSKFLREYAAKLSKSSKCERCTPSRSRARANDQKASSSTSLTVPSFETLLFSFGVGLGVFASGVHKLEVKRLNQLLEQSQAELETLKLELERRKSPLRTNRSESATGIVSKGQYSVRSYYGSEQQEDQMAELEAELEAELDQLTGGDSATMTSQYSAMDELDMDTSVVYGDLEPTGLPAGVEEDSDETSPGQPACLNNYAVSPRELTRLLLKLQTSRQDNLIADLEEDLEAALSKLQSREKELEFWKDRVKRLTKVSFLSVSADEYLTPIVPTEGVATEVSTAPRSVYPLGSQECPPIPMQEHEAPATGIVSEEDPAGPGSDPSTRPVTQGGLKSSLHKQEPADMGREGFSDGSSEITARDCKPILDNAQIISQLIDSVHGLESYGDRAESVEMGSTTPSQGLFSSSVSISDILDETPERHRDRGNLVPRARLVVPHPSRRTSYNSDVGNPVLIRNVLENETPTADVRYTESSSDTSEADYRTMEIPYSIKYIDSTAGPSSEPGISTEENPSYWVGQAGLTTPVEKARQQLFKSPQNAPADWPGELSPTVSEKIARWEGLMDGETPGPATGSDWECQSRASELDDANVFSEENLVLEAEEMLGRMLIKRIVEKSRLGSDSLVKKAHSALATLERDDGVELDAYHGDDTFINERTDSEADFSDNSDDHEKQQQTSFLDEAVREEYEFFRRLEIINKDRKSAKEKATEETAGGGAFDTVPELNAQLSPATQPSRITKALRKDVGEQQQLDDSGEEHSVKRLVKRNISGREDWLSRGDARPGTLRARSDHRQDEVRSRRRS